MAVVVMSWGVSCSMLFARHGTLARLTSSVLLVHIPCAVRVPTHLPDLRAAR